MAVNTHNITKSKKLREVEELFLAQLTVLPTKIF